MITWLGIDSRVRVTVIAAAVGVSLALVVLADVAWFPSVNLAIVYAIPVLVTALVSSPGVVVATSIEAVLADAIDIWTTGVDTPWAVTGAGLVVVCAFAVQLARQRGQTVRRAREAEEAQRDAQAAHQQLVRNLSVVSHELRQPLGVMVIALEVLEDEAGRVPPSEQRAIQMLARSVKGMRSLVTDLHDAAHVDSGRFAVRPEPMDLIAVGQGVMHDLRFSSPNHLLVLRAPSELEGCWDRQRVQQLLNNLLSNAVKYSPEGGTVTLAVERDGDRVAISVSDTGIGIAAEDLPRLFQPFTRLPTNARVDGTGLGLYLAKAITEAHGGRIDVRSTPGVGTTFTVTLPFESTRAELVFAPSR